MNRTFKVVFNKARGALMVANEATSSVQKSSTKAATVIAAASTFFLAMNVQANTTFVGNDVVKIENQTGVTVETSQEKNSNFGGIYAVLNTIKDNSIVIDNKTFSNNVFKNDVGHGYEGNYSDWTFGGVFYFYSKDPNGENKAVFSNTTFNGNSVHLDSVSGQNADAWVGGGALSIKGYDVTFKNVDFDNNSATSAAVDGTQKGAAATGGAILLDKTVSGKTEVATTARFVITKDMAYTGNYVKSASSNYAQAYGGYNTTSGGFMFMDRESTAIFDISADATLTIGEQGAADAGVDSIASSIHGSNYKLNDNLLQKIGAGTLVINSTLNDYFGLVSVDKGSMVVDRDWKIKNTVTVAGGTLTLNGDLDFGGFKDSATEKNIDKKVQDKYGSLVISSGKAILKGGFSDLSKVSIAKEGTLAFEGQTIDADANGDKSWITISTNKGGTVEVTGVNVSNQTSGLEDDTKQEGGAAINLKGNVETDASIGGSLLVKDSTFTKNVTGFRGGAISVNNTYFAEKNAATVVIENSVFSENEAKTTTDASNRMGGALFIRGADTTITDTDFTNNLVTAKDGYAEGGGALYILGYGSNDSLTQTGGSYVGNKVVVSGNLEEKEMKQQALGGGAVVLKGTQAVFEDVLFQNNVVDYSASDGKVAVTGGAIAADYSTGSTNSTGGEGLGTSVTFNISQDMAYTGNSVVASAHGTQIDKFINSGYVSPVLAGGFLMLQRGSTADFNVADGATLTLGTEGQANLDTDSIASDLPSTQVFNTADGVSTLTKSGAGTLLIHSTLNKYFGKTTVAGGTMDVRTDWTSGNAITINDGATLLVKSLTLDTLANAFDAQTTSGASSNFHSNLTSVPVQGTVSINAGGLLSVGDLTVTNGSVTANGTLEVSGALTGAPDSVTVDGGTLKTGSTNVFTLAKNAGALFAAEQTAQFVQADDEVSDTNSTLTLTSGTIALTDEGYYTNSSLSAMSSQLDEDMVLTILNAQAVLQEGETSVDLVEGVVHNDAAGVESTVTTASDPETGATTTTAKTNISTTTAGGTSLEVRADADRIGEAASVDVVLAAENAASNHQVTLVLKGTEAGGDLVTVKAESADGSEPAKTVAVQNLTIPENVTLQLGSGANAAETSGSLNNVTVGTADASTAQLSVQNMNAQVATLSGTGTVLVGSASGSNDNGDVTSSNGSRATLKVASLDMDGGLIFVDPAWDDTTSLQSIAKASHLEISQVAGGVLDTKLVGGQNSLITIGATTEQATAAFNSIVAASSEVDGWGKDAVSAAIYLGERVVFGSSNGGILVDGSLSSAPLKSDVAQALTVANGGMVMTDSSLLTDAAQPLVAGTLAYKGTTGNAYIGITNAQETTYYIAESVTGAENFKVVTDNPFIVGGTPSADGTIQTSVDAQSGLAALSSTGLQAMTRRADTVLAQTIADRTSTDQELKAGLNLWVDVTGENYESDDFDHGGEFTADMGYGTFGGDVAFGNFTVGGAFQYGTGSLRSSVSNIKNDIDNYGVSLYGTYKVSDAFKLAAELAYVWGENDITSSQTALNQSVDTEMYSFGLRAMYEVTAGNFSFVPSIGLRVSQLSTDEMKVGSVKVDDQDQTLVQVPIALRINAADFNAGGWVVAPSMKIAYVPTFGDKDIEVLHHTQDVIDTAPVQADIGLRVGKDNMLFNVNMLLGSGEYGTSAIGGKVGFKYVF